MLTCCPVFKCSHCLHVYYFIFIFTGLVHSKTSNTLRVKRGFFRRVGRFFRRVVNDIKSVGKCLLLWECTVEPRPMNGGICSIGYILDYDLPM